MISFLSKRDYSLFVFPILLSIFGLSTVFSFGSTNAIFTKQIILFFSGLTLAVFISFLDLRFLKTGHYIFIFYILCIILLAVLVIIGHNINGAQSWFRFFGISLQPIEIAKLALIGVLAKFFYKRHTEISYLPTLIYSFIYVSVVFALTILQPDLGSAMVVLGIWFGIVFVSGIPYKYILGIFGIFLAVAFVSWNVFLAPYQKARILNFVDPTRDIRGSGYNVYQSMIAVGSGGLWGKGINFGSQSKLSYLPEYETDFIFAAFAEEWGYIGVLLCLITYLLLILRILFLAGSMESNFEIIFLVGIATYFIIHFCVNVGMNIGLLPVTGIPLPFMSSGGTHVIVEWVMLGIIVGNTRNKKRLIKEVKSKEMFVF